MEDTISGVNRGWDSQILLMVEKYEVHLVLKKLCQNDRMTEAENLSQVQEQGCT